MKMTENQQWQMQSELVAQLRKLADAIEADTDDVRWTPRIDQQSVLNQRLDISIRLQGTVEASIGWTRSTPQGWMPPPPDFQNQV